MLQRLFKARPALDKGRRLYAAVTTQARTPAFYADLDVPDTNEGRFELYTLHLALVLRRLKRQGAWAEEVSQALFDRYIDALDDGLREIGVGDLSVGRKMRKLGEALYGRLKHYDEALAGDGLEPLIARTIYAGRDGADAGPLASYMREADAALTATPLAQVIDGELAWPHP